MFIPFGGFPFVFYLDFRTERRFHFASDLMKKAQCS
jgi:hypothetical protein